MYKIYDWPKNKMHAHQRSHLLSAISNSLFKYNLESTWVQRVLLFRCWSWVALTCVDAFSIYVFSLIVKQKSCQILQIKISDIITNGCLFWQHLYCQILWIILPILYESYVIIWQIFLFYTMPMNVQPFIYAEISNFIPGRIRFNTSILAPNFRRTENKVKTSILLMKMVHKSYVYALSFGTVFSHSFEIGINKQVNVFWKVINRPRTDCKNLFLGVWNIHTVYLRIVNLF